MSNLFLREQPKDEAVVEPDFDALVRDIRNWKDFIAAAKNSIKSETSDLMRAVIFFCGFLLLLLPLFLIAAFFPQSSIGVVGSAIILSANGLVVLRTVVKVTYWYCKEPSVVFLNATFWESPDTRKVQLWEAVFVAAGLKPVTVESAEGDIVHDEDNQLSVKLNTWKRTNVRLFRNHTFDETEEHQYEPPAGELEKSLKERFEYFAEVPERYRLMLFCYDVHVFPRLIEGARLGVPPRTLAALIDHDIPESQWDELKDYPAEWVTNVA